MKHDIRALVRIHLKDLISNGDWTIVTEEWAAKHGRRRVRGAEFDGLSRQERVEWNRILLALIKEVTPSKSVEAKKKQKKTACANCHQGQHAHLGKPNCQESRCGCPCRKKS